MFSLQSAIVLALMLFGFSLAIAPTKQCFEPNSVILRNFTLIPTMTVCTLNQTYVSNVTSSLKKANGQWYYGAPYRNVQVVDSNRLGSYASGTLNDMMLDVNLPYLFELQCFSQNGVRNKDCEAQFVMNMTNTVYNYTGTFSFCLQRLLKFGYNTTYMSGNFTSPYCDINWWPDTRIGLWDYVGTVNQHSSSWQCKCAHYGLVSTEQIKDKFKRWVNVESSRTTRILTIDNLNETSYSYSLDGGRHLLGANLSEIITISLKQETILVSFEDNTVDHFVRLQKDEYVSMTKCSEPLFSLKLPKSVWSKSGYLYVDVYANQYLLTKKTFIIVGSSDCRFTDCIICWQAFDNWRCLPETYQITIIGILLTIFLILWKFFPKIGPFIITAIYYIVFWPLGKMFKFLRPVGRIPAVMDSRVTVVNNVSKFKNYFLKPKADADIETASVNLILSDNQPVTNTRNTVVAKGSNSRLGKTIVFALCLTCLLGFGDAQCDTGSIISSTVTACQDLGNGVQKCSVALEAEVIVQAPGTMSCFAVSDSDNGNLIGQIKISYLNFTSTINLDSDYYTSDFDMYSESNRRCPHADKCSSTYCANYDGSDRTANGELSSYNVVNYPGTSECHTGCACSGCGCFLCTDSCIWSGYGIVPKGPIAQVFEIGQSSAVPTIRFTMTDSRNITVVDEEINLVGVTTQVNTFLITIIGTLSYSDPSFEDWKLIDYNGYSYLGTACNVNEECTGVPGDIQANDPSDLQTALVNAFRYSPGLVITDNGDSDTSYSSLNSGLNSMTNLAAYLILPEVINGNFWKTSDGFLVGSILDPGAVELTLQDTGDLVVTVYEDVVCPMAKLMTVSGCYSCSTGAVANISLTSSCRSGLVGLSANVDYISITTPTEFALSDPNDVLENYILITFFTAQAKNSFKLNFIGSGSNYSITIDFTAIASDKVSNQTTVPSDNQTDKTSFWKDFINFWTEVVPEFFKEIFIGKASWWKYLIFSGIIIGVIVLCIILLPPLFEFLAQSHFSKKMMSYSNSIKKD